MTGDVVEQILLKDMYAAKQSPDSLTASKGSILVVTAMGIPDSNASGIFQASDHPFSLKPRKSRTFLVLQSIPDLVHHFLITNRKR